MELTRTFNLLEGITIGQLLGRFAGGGHGEVGGASMPSPSTILPESPQNLH